MNDKFNQFFNTWNGKECEISDPTNYAQCIDLAYAWCDALGVPRTTINNFYAYQVWTQPKDITVQRFEMIPNTPTGLPIVGDLVVFSNRVGVAGHIAIATGEGNTDSFVTFDQNWGTPKTCRKVTHNFDAVFGWLRLRVPPIFVITDQTPLPIIDENGNRMEVQAVRSRLADLASQVKNCQINCESRINDAITTTKAETEVIWQIQLESAKAEIARLKDLQVDNIDWRTLMSIAWKKFWTWKKTTQT